MFYAKQDTKQLLDNYWAETGCNGGVNTATMRFPQVSLLTLTGNL